MASVSIGDIVKICKIISETISRCLAASGEKLAQYEVLTSTQDMISLFITGMNQYILYEDQKQAWYQKLTMCKLQLFELRETLDHNHNHNNDDDDNKNNDPSTDNSKSAKKNLNLDLNLQFLENIKFALFQQERIERQMRGLKVLVKELYHLHDLILREATKKSMLHSLRFPEKAGHEA